MMSTHDKFTDEKSTLYYEVMRVKRDTLYPTPNRSKNLPLKINVLETGHFVSHLKFVKVHMSAFKYKAWFF